MNKDPITTFFEAKSFAIVGATGNKDKLGWFIIDNFLTHFDGDLYLVNAKGGEIEGMPVYKNVLEIPVIVDAVVIAIPARFVQSVVEDCVKKGIKSVIIESGGFAEVGDEGKLLQEKLVETIKDTGTRIMGPNCIGVLSPEAGIDTIFIPQDRVGRPKGGPISFFTQSGAMGSAILSSLHHAGDGAWISRFASYGNACDVNEVDFIKYMGQDLSTRIIMAHLEGFRDGYSFLKEAKKITPKKPIVLLKTNRTELGATASASHSASVASDDAVVTALMKQHGIIRVEDFEEMTSLARALRTQPIPRGARIGVVTDGGGFAVSASDAIEKEGLSLGNLDKQTFATLKAKYPPWYISGNPLDLTGTVTAEEFQFGIEQFCFDPNIDAILMIIIPSAPQFDVHDFINIFSDFIVNIKDKHPESAIKPIFSVTLGGEESQIIDAKMEKLDIPVFSTPDKALTIVKYLVEYRNFLNHNRTLLLEGRY